MRIFDGSVMAAFCLVAGLLSSPDMARGAELQVPDQYATIGSAIEAASNGDLIVIAAGTYLPSETVNPQGKSITLRGAVDRMRPGGPGRTHASPQGRLSELSGLVVTG